MCATFLRASCERCYHADCIDICNGCAEKGRADNFFCFFRTLGKNMSDYPVKRSTQGKTSRNSAPKATPATAGGGAGNQIDLIQKGIKTRVAAGAAPASGPAKSNRPDTKRD